MPYHRFNPRARAGRDRIIGEQLLELPVSIHAPARGATLSIRQALYSVMFQSTRPRGARQTRVSWGEGDREFQSTRPRGARRERLQRRLPGSCFNPRARAGRDRKFIRPQSSSSSFNPRARAGRDTLVVIDAVVRRLFQSTRPRGARLSTLCTPRIRVSVSIHAPARGATQP